MSFFRIVGTTLEFDLAYISFYKEFKAILTDDLDYTEKIFKYIYEVADNRSYSNRNVLSKDEAHHRGITLAGLPLDFKTSKEINTAIKKYKELNKNHIADLLKDLKATLFLSIKINERIHKVLDARLSNPELKDEEIPTLVNLQGKLFDTIDAIPNRIQKIKELEVVVYNELAKPDIIGKGGEVIPDSYDGDPEIEGT